MHQTTPIYPTFKIDPALCEMKGAVQDEHRHLSYNFLIIHFCAVICFGAVTFCAQARVARGVPLLRLGRDQACMRLGSIAAGVKMEDKAEKRMERTEDTK